mgnify:CR=1 FL=1
MPPKKKQAEVAPVSPVRMLMTYAGSPITTTAKTTAKLTKRMIEKMWDGALAQIMGSKGAYWARATEVQWISRTPGDSVVVFHVDEVAAPVARIKVSVLQGDEARARVVKQIILGFSDGSVVAHVNGVGHLRGKITLVEFDTSLDEGDGNTPLGLLRAAAEY